MNNKMKTMEPADPMTTDPVRLVASARFFAESLTIPPGISSRDLPGFLEGEVEELSLFPLEATSWGYMENRGKGLRSTILLYAAFREHVNGATDPHYAQRYAVLPGFAVLLGRTWRKATWITLVEPECVTLVRFPARSDTPDQVRGLYLPDIEDNSLAVWEAQEKLFQTVEVGPDDHVEEGVVRCGKPSIDRKGTITFPLERCRAYKENWKRFGNGKIAAESTLLAADTRDTRFLLEERNRRRAVKQLRVFLKLAALGFIMLALFQFRYMRLRDETAALSEQLAAQRPAVEALQQQETLAKSAGQLGDPPLEIFAWLTAVNEVRPDAISFLTAYADREGNLGFSGEAPSVAVVNQYRDALGKTNTFNSVETKEINSAKRGVKFTIQVNMKSDKPNEPEGDAS